MSKNLSLPPIDDAVKRLQSELAASVGAAATEARGRTGVETTKQWRQPPVRVRNTHHVAGPRAVPLLRPVKKLSGEEQEHMQGKLALLERQWNQALHIPFAGTESFLGGDRAPGRRAQSVPVDVAAAVTASHQQHHNLTSDSAPPARPAPLPVELNMYAAYSPVMVSPNPNTSAAAAGQFPAVVPANSRVVSDDEIQRLLKEEREKERLRVLELENKKEKRLQMEYEMELAKERAKLVGWQRELEWEREKARIRDWEREREIERERMMEQEMQEAKERARQSEKDREKMDKWLLEQEHSREKSREKMIELDRQRERAEELEREKQRMKERRELLNMQDRHRFEREESDKRASVYEEYISHTGFLKSAHSLQNTEGDSRATLLREEADHREIALNGILTAIMEVHQRERKRMVPSQSQTETNSCNRGAQASPPESARKTESATQSAVEHKNGGCQTDLDFQTREELLKKAAEEALSQHFAKLDAERTDMQREIETLKAGLNQSGNLRSQKRSQSPPSYAQKPSERKSMPLIDPSVITIYSALEQLQCNGVSALLECQKAATSSLSRSPRASEAALNSYFVTQSILPEIEGEVEIDVLRPITGAQEETWEVVQTPNPGTALSDTKADSALLGTYNSLIETTMASRQMRAILEAPPVPPRTYAELAWQQRATYEKVMAAAESGKSGKISGAPKNCSEVEDPEFNSEIHPTNNKNFVQKLFLGVHSHTPPHLVNIKSHKTV